MVSDPALSGTNDSDPVVSGTSDSDPNFGGLFQRFGERLIGRDFKVRAEGIG